MPVAEDVQEVLLPGRESGSIVFRAGAVQRGVLVGALVSGDGQMVIRKIK